MEQNKKIRVAITHGNTNGIGYEVILKALEDPMMLELCTPVIYGSPKVAAYHRKAMELQTQFTIIDRADEAKPGKVNLLTTVDDEIKVELGSNTPEAAEAAKRAKECALKDVAEGLCDVLVLAPESQEDSQGKSENGSLDIRISGDLRIALVTNEMAIKDVPEAITQQKIIDKVKLLNNTLRRDFRISTPRIAILALNPIAGENGNGGEEEQETIKPAIERLEQEGIQAFGPYPTDKFFGNGDYQFFDAVLAMYYEQGVTPLKTIAPEGGIILTTGLNYIQTTTDEGAQFDIAGKGTADESALRNAIYMAIDAFRNRQNYEEPLQNPLPKLYHEKRDESERIRFSVPKTKQVPPTTQDKG